MAARQVAETNELVEFVLQELPMKEIFLARRVSRSWNALIECSLPLKRATFRRASDVMTLDEDEAEILDLSQHDYSSSLRLPPITSTDFEVSPLFTSNSDLAGQGLRKRGACYYYTRFIRSLYTHLSLTPSTSLKDFRHQNVFIILTVSDLRKLKTSLVSETYLTNPPTTALCLSLLHTRIQEFLSTATLKHSEGINLSLVIDTFEAMIRPLKEMHICDTDRLVFRMEFRVG